MESSVVHFDEVLKRLDGDKLLFRELAAFFCEDSPALLREIRAGLDEGSVPRIRRAAHRLRSMLENFDAEHAVAAARTIERSSSRDDLPLVPAALAQLEADVKSVQDALGE